MENTRKLEVLVVNGHNEVVTTTKEHAEELVNSFFDNGKKGLELYINNCLTLAELRATKGYLLLGYNSFYSDKGKADTPILKALFGSESDSDTEAKNMCLLATTFGIKQYDDNKNSLDRWAIDDDTMKIMCQLSKGVLFELPALRECADSNQSLKALLESLGVKFDNENNIIETPISLTVKGMRDIKALERKHKEANNYLEAKEAEESLKAQAKTLADSKEAETGTEEAETGTEEAETGTEEAETGTEDIMELPKEELTLKEVKALLKSGMELLLNDGEKDRYIVIK